MKKALVIKHFGSALAVAEALGIKSAAVYQWGDEVPRLRAYQLERITGGALRVSDCADCEPQAKAS